jgi:D-tyrosyl-tRNA(Tyr) deacylase
VTIGGKVNGAIGRGFLILLGIGPEDTKHDATKLAEKLLSLRIFTDENDKMNLSVTDVDGEVLCVSQFTLCADVKKGNRPSFTPSAAPAEAERLYEYFMRRLRDEGVRNVAHGVFGADMKVRLLNDGPVTILFDSQTWIRR